MTAEKEIAMQKTGLTTAGLQILPTTMPRLVRIWWAFMWRYVVAALSVTVLGAIAGAVMGAIMGAAGASQEVASAVAILVGLALGLGISVVPVWMILGKSFGDCRLVLVSRDAA